MRLLTWITNEFVEWYLALLRCIPGEAGCVIRRFLYGFHAETGVRVLSHVIIHCPRRLAIGAHSGISQDCQLHAGGGIRIGRNVLIGPGVFIWSQSHRWESADVLICDQGWKREKITIGDDVWIGAGAIILPGVHLGEGTVVAAGAVVTQSTARNSLVAGVPARAIRQRQPDNQEKAG